MLQSHRHIQRVVLVALLVLAFTVCGQSQPPIESNDVIIGFSDANPATTLESARGPVVELGGEFEWAFWNQPFIQSVEFDNLNGLSHNPEGNLLGLNFGPGGDDGGSIYNLAAAEAVEASQLIGDTLGLGGEGLTSSRLGGLSVSPNNSMIAVTGYDSGRVIVYDYTAGNGKGDGASLVGARESQDGFLNQFDTQGTAWRNSNHVMTLAADGSLVQIDATTMAHTVLAKVETGDGADVNRATSTDVEYNPAVSPYVYASYGTFDRDTNETINSLFVLDPTDNFSVVKTIDNSQSMQTAREIALDTAGNLFLSQFSATIDFIANAVDPGSMTDNSTVDWYIPLLSSGFNGMDVALGLPIDLTLKGDFNENGVLDEPDINDLTVQSASQSNPPSYDLNDDSLVDRDDVRVWIRDLFDSWVGDANLDGEFNSTDLTAVLAAGLYDTANPSDWASGDFNGDGFSDSSDLTEALADGGYEQGPRVDNVAAVPEPSGAMLGFAALLPWMGRWVRRMRRR